MEHVLRLDPAALRAGDARARVGDAAAHGGLVPELGVADQRHAQRHGLRRRVAAAVGYEGLDLGVRQGPRGGHPVVDLHGAGQSLWQAHLLSRNDSSSIHLGGNSPSFPQNTGYSLTVGLGMRELTQKCPTETRPFPPFSLY